MTNYLLSILCFMSLISCNQTYEKELDTVNCYGYQLWLSDLDRVDLKVSTKLVIDKNEVDGKTRYDLKAPKSDMITAFSYSIKDDSLFYENTYSKIIDTINLEHKGSRVQLFISDYDELFKADEESYLFWNTRYGLVGQYNWSMGPVTIFEPANLVGFSKTLYDYIVERERLRNK